MYLAKQETQYMIQQHASASRHDTQNNVPYASS